MAQVELEVDTSELDVAIEKAQRLSAMLDEIEGRLSALDDERANAQGAELLAVLAEFRKGMGYDESLPGFHEDEPLDV